MSKELVARLRKGRELKVTIGKWTFAARRPTDVEAVSLYRGGMAYAEIAQQYVSGWENVTEDDVVGGGTIDPITFDPVLWKEWCADRTDFWQPISEAVLAAYEEHTKRIGDAVKN